MFNFILILCTTIPKSESIEYETNNLLQTIGGWFIDLYQLTLSKIQGDVCNYTPSCSHYTEKTIKKYGLLKGIFMGTDRLLRCHSGAWAYKDVYYKVKYVKYRGWKLYDKPEDNYIW